MRGRTQQSNHDRWVSRSPDGAIRAFTPVFDGLWRNPGPPLPHCATLHAGYSRRDVMRLTSLAAAAIASLAFASTPVRADDYPARFVTMVSPYAAGGGADLIARVVAQKLTERLGR